MKNLAQLASLFAAFVVVGAVLWEPLQNWTNLGTHDWDQMEAHRYLMIKSLRRYGQFPFWDPYGCGGHPSWAGIESGTAIVSPLFPVYMLLPFAVALRVEVLLVPLLSALGTWLFAARYTKSGAARLVLCALFVVNTRWAFQASTGHTWHMYYAWVPWAFWAFDAACEHVLPGLRRRILPIAWKYVLLLGMFVALMVYTGAIYPLPQTVLLLGLVAMFRSARDRTWRPMVSLAIAGVFGGALAAPKLLPIIDTMRRYPRLIDSNETVDLGVFVRLLIDNHLALAKTPIHFSQWGFHEYGMYIGSVAAALVFVSLFFAPKDARVRALLWVGVLCMILGMGTFHEHAPWPELHKLPVFKSQHVPSRWMYPGILLLGAVFAATWEQVLRKLGRISWLGELVMFATAIFISVDVAREAAPIMNGSFSAPPLSIQDSVGEYYQELKAPPHLQYSRPDYGPPALPQHVANVGTIECITFPGLNVWAPKDSGGRIRYLGARARGESEYRGEVFLYADVGKAKIERWSPNEVIVAVSGARPGDLLVLNQNWDESWTANGEPSSNTAWTNGYRLKAADEKVVFRYRPRLFVPGCALSALALTFCASLARRSWKARRIRLASGAPAR